MALSGDGRRLLVGAPRTDCAEGDRCGVAYLFDRDRTWEPAPHHPPGRPTPATPISATTSRSAATGAHLAVQGAVIHVFTLDDVA